MSNKNSKNLSWDAFTSMGNPDNAPELPEEKQEDPLFSKMKVRIVLEKKNRRGKEATVILGLDLDDDALSDMAKLLKKKCGVGGSSKNGEIILQGNHRDKVLLYLKEKGVKDVKKSGG